MKTLSQLKLMVTLVFILTLFTCSNDDENIQDLNASGESYIDYEINGSAMQGGSNAFNISNASEANGSAITILAGFSHEDTDEGTQKVLNLIFSKYTSEDNYYDISMSLKPNIGDTVLGEFVTGSTGMITYQPTFNLVMSFDSQTAFYDGDNDGDTDLLTDLLSKNINITITEYEETTNSLGLEVPKHVKGKIISGNQGFFKTYTGPTSPPAELLHNITKLEFEYNLPVQ